MKILVILGISLVMFVLLSLLGKLFGLVEDKLEFAPEILTFLVLIPVLILQVAVVAIAITAMDKVLSGTISVFLDAVFAALWS